DVRVLLDVVDAAAGAAVIDDLLQQPAADRAVGVEPEAAGIRSRRGGLPTDPQRPGVAGERFGLQTAVPRPGSEPAPGDARLGARRPLALSRAARADQHGDDPDENRAAHRLILAGDGRTGTADTVRPSSATRSGAVRTPRPQPPAGSVDARSRL